MPGDEHLSAKVTLQIGGASVDMEVVVPAGPARPSQLVPLAHAIADAAVEVATDQAVSEGRAISCRKGCGACCRQLVPVALAEARQLAALVAALPEPRRTDVRARFDRVRQRLAGAGLLDRMFAAGALARPEERQDLGQAYFALGIACPFLVDESCGIHPKRPSACREYLVTSPAAACAQPSADTIDRVEVSTRVSTAQIRLDAAASPGAGGWVPLSVALAWDAANPEAPPTRTGPDLLRDFLRELGRPTAGAPGGPAPRG